MNKVLRTIFSIEFAVVFMLLFALSCAIATFIENDFGTLGAKSFIYNQTWFELIMLFLTLCVIFNIIWFKMYKSKKFFIFLIHISFVFILVGSALTRYKGYEGVMTIPEFSIQNRMLSNDEYIQATLLDSNNKEIIKVDKKVLITKLSQTNFDINIDDIKISFDKFVPNAAEKIVDTKDGKAMLNLIITTLNGAKSIDLQDNKIYEDNYAVFSLNKEIKQNSKPKIYFITKDNKLYVKSNLSISYSFMDGLNKGSIKANEALELRDDIIYEVAQTKFTVPDFSNSGKIDVVSIINENISEEKIMNAVIANVIYKNRTQKVALFGKGGANEGYTRTIKLDDKTLKLSWGAKIIEIPFSLYLNDFNLIRYPGSNSPSNYSSDVKVYDTKDDKTFEYKITMNEPLTYKGFKFFQSSYTMNETATVLSVNKDPGVIPTYIGYFLLFTGLILSLFMKNSRFRKLANKKYEIKNISLALLSFFILNICTTTLNAQELSSEELTLIKNIDKNHANEFASLIVQDYQGRIKPINSLAIEIMNKVIRKDTLYDLDANQLFISMLINPRIWQKIPIIKVKDENIKKLLGIKKEDKYFAFNDVYTNFGSYKFEDELELANKKRPANRTTFDKELIKVDERLNIIYNLFSGAFLKLFPKIDDNNNKWIDPTIAISALSDDIGALNKDEAQKIIELMDRYFITIKNANENKANWSNATKTLNEIKIYQKQYANHIIPNSYKIKAELFFNKINIFERLTPIYLIIGFILLIVVFIKILNPNLNISKMIKISVFLLTLLFFIHTLGLILRWYISGHAPWSNGYESMIYIAWAIILSGIYFSKQSYLALASTSILSGITLFVAHLSWLEPQITTLTPVLKSYWLTIHVSVITASYGFLALSALLGFISLLLYIFVKRDDEIKQKSIMVSILEARRVNEMSMLIGLVLLVIGNFLGGIWANESWGRYWGWDPKETWTLVSILIYSVILHLQYIKGLASNFLFSTLSLISYSSIIMTYFGVNYYLSGMHSYAAGDPIPIPSFVPIALVIVIIVILLAYKNRKII